MRSCNPRAGAGHPPWRLAAALAALLLAALPARALPLWEVTGTRGHVQVLGSIHFLRPEDYPLPAAMTEAMDRADVLVMELDLDDLDPTTTAAAVAALARDPKGRGLHTLLGPDAWRADQDKARQLELDLMPLEPFEPWYAAVIVTQLRLAQLGFDPDFGVENRFLAEARAKSRQIRGFETLEEQLGALDGLSPAAQAEFLANTLDEAAEAGDEVDRILAAWKAGDTAVLEKDLLKEVVDQPELYRRLVVERNRKFARGIAKLAREPGNFLVIVGTLHLVGPDSVIRMLEAEGFTVRQVP